MMVSGKTLALINGVVYSFAAPGKCSALFSRNGAIEKVGCDRDILALCDKHTTVLDLKKCILIPGFVDLNANVSISDLKTGDGVVREMLGAGLTLIQSDFSVAEEEGVWASLKEMRALRKAAPRVLPRFVVRSLSDIEALRENDVRYGRNHDPFRRMCIRIALDGGIDDRTTALSDDYADAPGCRGGLLIESENLFAMLCSMADDGWNITLQANGDAAIEQVLRTLERMKGECFPRSSLFSIAGAEAGRPDQYKRMAALGVGVELYPMHIVPQWPLVLPRLGAARARMSFAWRTMLKCGIEVGFASGFPFGSFAPLSCIQTMLERRDATRTPVYSGMPNEAIDRVEAFWMYTGGCAGLLGQSALRGTLEPGKLADMTVLMENPFAIPVEEISNVKIGMTVVAGNVKEMI